MRIVAVALFSSVLAAGSPAGAQDLPPSSSAILSAPDGRYVFGQISPYRRDQFMLDTKTGRLWVKTEAKSGLVELQDVPYEGLSGVSLLPPQDSVSDLTGGPWRSYQQKKSAANSSPAKPPPGYKLDPQ